MPEFKRRIETSRRLIHEQGITYNVYGDARGNERPWQIDPVPFIISAKEWEKLESGLIQRATLINHHGVSSRFRQSERQSLLLE